MIKNVTKINEMFLKTNIKVTKKASENVINLTRISN